MAKSTSKSRKEGKILRAPRPGRRTQSTRKAICVRVDDDVFNLLSSDANEWERSIAAQCRLILRQHYGMGDEEEGS